MKNRIFLKVTFFLVNMFLIFFNTNQVKAGWEIETVDNSGDVQVYFSSLALDGGDKPHIGYADPSANIKYATYNGNIWDIKTVELMPWPLPTPVPPTSLTLDSNDIPHISYPFPGGIKYAYYNGSSWESYQLSLGGGYISLALDSNGIPHIAYMGDESSGQVLHYAYNLNSIRVVSPCSGFFDGFYASLALDSTDNPHISHYNLFNDVLNYSSYNGSSWECEPVASSGYGGSLALDSTDNPHICFIDVTTDVLNYSSRNGSSWATETVDNSVEAAYTSLALDSNDNPHICYQDSNGNLKYASYNGTNWEIETVDNDAADIFQASLDLDSNDIPHISYHSSNGDLKYAQQCPEEDFDCDNVLNVEDNCSNDYNPNQEDTYPPQGNNRGDACDCECDFDCDGNVDADDVRPFLIDFGRSILSNPCTNANPCNGDVNCDGNVDATDVTTFLEDFGRSVFQNPCPACVTGDWCVYD